MDVKCNPFIANKNKILRDIDVDNEYGEAIHNLPVDVLDSPQYLSRYMQKVSDGIRKVEKTTGIFMMITDAFKLGFLKEIVPYLSQKDYNECLSATDSGATEFTESVATTSPFQES